MRIRAWRRYKLELIVKKRLKKFNSESSWWSFDTANGDSIRNPIWSDHIGTQNANFYKTGVTKKSDSKYNIKYSPNRNFSYHRDYKKRGDSLGTREKDKAQFLKILKDNGLK